MDEVEMKQRLKRLMHKFHKKAQAAYLTTIDGGGFPHTRTMVNLRNDKAFPLAAPLFEGHDQDFLTYFSTVKGFDKLKHIEMNPKVSVFYCHPREWWSLLLKGTLEIVQDEGIRKRVWHDDWYEIFPSGVLDPNQVVLRLNPIYALGLCTIERQRYVFELI